MKLQFFSKVSLFSFKSVFFFVNINIYKIHFLILSCFKRKKRDKKLWKKHRIIDLKFSKTYHKHFLYSHLFLYKNCTKFLLLLLRLLPDMSLPTRGLVEKYFFQFLRKKIISQQKYRISELTNCRVWKFLHPKGWKTSKN